MAQKFTVPVTIRNLSSPGSDGVTVYIDQDTYARLKLEAGGRIVWGPGDAAGDVNLYRDEANVLRTDDTFKTPVLFVDNIEIDTTSASVGNVLKFDGTKFSPGIASTVGSIDDLSDVIAPSPSDGQYLKYVSASSAWIPATGGSIINFLDDIGDVSAPAPGSGDFLKWDGSAWVPDAVPTINFLDDIGDVIISSASATQVLTYDGTNWVNQNPSIGSGNLDGGSAITIYGGVFALSGGSA